MKNTIVLLMLIGIAALAQAQTTEESNKSAPGKEQGLLFSFNDSSYLFQLGGFVQPSYAYQERGKEPAENFLNIRRAYLRIAGTAVKEKVSFLVQTDFADGSPLLDAWIAYHPIPQLTFTVGQKQNIANNREMLFREDRLQFTDRSELSRQLSRTGREFGLFVEGRLGEKFGIAPILAVTSGDGRNSFGVDSRDVDLGGLKFSGRLDVLPLGYFSPGNELYSADLAHEQNPKLVIGTAYSFNRGATQKVGEGHGEFFLFNDNGKVSLPNYQKIYVDLMAKYKGFSALLEYGNASANGLSSNFINAEATQRLLPKQISTFLALGNTYNMQMGYVTKAGYSMDLRHGKVTPEFSGVVNNALTDQENYTLGLSRYFRGNHTKVQTSFSYLKAGSGTETLLGELLVQMSF
jgi:hypothetical protein